MNKINYHINIIRMLTFLTFLFIFDCVNNKCIQNIMYLRRSGNTAENMPRQAYTMGIKTIMQARKVLVVANGLAKAKAVKAVVSGPVTPECPGSILQLHPDCTLVADEEALSLL